MTHIVPAVILFAIAAAAFILSFRCFREKGFLLNNAWIYASKKDREAMDKKPYYRQSALVFLQIGLIFLLNGLAILLAAFWLTYVAIGLMVLTGIYAIVSTAAIEKKKKQP